MCQQSQHGIVTSIWWIIGLDIICLNLLLLWYFTLWAKNQKKVRHTTVCLKGKNHWFLIFFSSKGSAPERPVEQSIFFKHIDFHLCLYTIHILHYLRTYFRIVNFSNKAGISQQHWWHPGDHHWKTRARSVTFHMKFLIFWINWMHITDFFLTQHFLKKCHYFL